MLPGIIPAVRNIKVFKNALYKEYYTFQYELAENYELVISAKKKLSDTEEWFSMEYDFYTSADPKKFLIFMEPTDTRAIDTTTTSKGYWSLEVRSLTDPEDRAVLLYGEVVVRERTTIDGEDS